MSNKQTNDEPRGELFFNEKPIDKFEIFLRSGKSLEWNKWAEPMEDRKIYIKTYRDDIRMFEFYKDRQESAYTFPMETVDYYMERTFKTGK